MQIKKYTAPNITQALQLVKDDWGDEAFVLSSRTISQGKTVLSEVTAAREDTGSEMFSTYYQKLVQAGLNEDTVLKVLIQVNKEKGENETISPGAVREKIKEKLKLQFIQQMDNFLNNIL